MLIYTAETTLLVVNPIKTTILDVVFQKTLFITWIMLIFHPMGIWELLEAKPWMDNTTLQRDVLDFLMNDYFQVEMRWKWSFTD